MRITDEINALELFIPKVFVDLVVEESIDYAVKSDQSHKVKDITYENVRCVMAVILLSGYNSFPERNHYHEQSPDVGCPLVQESIRRDVLENVLSCMHLAGKGKDEKLEQSRDRWWKLRPMFQCINETAKA